MKHRRLLAVLVVVVLLGSEANGSHRLRAAIISTGAKGLPGVTASAVKLPSGSKAAVVSPKEERPTATSSAPSTGGLALDCLERPLGFGNVVIPLDYGDCYSPREKAPEGDDEVAATERLPSPEELAWVAADRAMSVAEWPVLKIAPGRIGLTGLRSFFWLDHAPAPVTASASIPGLVVTAEAHPIEYTWSFGEGRAQTTSHPGRAWTKRRPGNVAHMYERRGRYRVSVEVLWQGRWRMNSGPWQHLGYFSNGDSRAYPVRQMVAMLTRRR